MSDETKIVFWKYNDFISCRWGEIIGDDIVKGYGRMNFGAKYIIAILPKSDADPIIKSLVELNSIQSRVNEDLSLLVHEVIDLIREK